MRQPIYHEQSKAYRVISVANGAWQAQHHIARGASQDSRIYSGWKPISRATSQEEALRRIYTALPLKQ